MLPFQVALLFDKPDVDRASTIFVTHSVEEREAIFRNEIMQMQRRDFVLARRQVVPRESTLFTVVGLDIWTGIQVMGDTIDKHREDSFHYRVQVGKTIIFSGTATVDEKGIFLLPCPLMTKLISYEKLVIDVDISPLESILLLGYTVNDDALFKVSRLLPILSIDGVKYIGTYRDGCMRPMRTVENAVTIPGVSWVWIKSST